MSLIMVKKTKDSYLDKISVKAVSTRRNFNASYKSFERFCLEKYDRTAEQIIQEIPQEKESEFEVLQAWVNWLLKSITPITIHSRFSSLRGYFHYRGIKMYKEDINQNITLPTMVKEEKHPISLEEIRTITSNANPKKKALYLVLLSSGMRVGETVQLKKKHFDLSTKRTTIKIPADYTKTKQGRTVFISKEATAAIKPLLRQINDNDGVFSKNPNPHYAVCAEEMTFKRILTNVGLVEPYESSRTNKITMHSFRAYYFTKAARKHGDNYAHMMTGHGGYLMMYDRLTDNEKLKMYLELEPYLLIDELVIKDREIEEQQKQITELSKRDERIREMEKKLALFEQAQAEREDIGRRAKEYHEKNPELTNIIEEYMNKELANLVKKKLFKPV